jgi:curved DNA-binding protein CbpA
MTKDIDHYAVLGVSPQAGVEEIRKAYYARAKACHPDRGGSHRQMRAVNEAWEILGDAVLRQQYDALRLRPVTPVPARKRPREKEQRTIISDIGDAVGWVVFWIGRAIGAIVRLVSGRGRGSRG